MTMAMILGVVMVMNLISVIHIAREYTSAGKAQDSKAEIRRGTQWLLAQSLFWPSR